MSTADIALAERGIVDAVQHLRAAQKALEMVGRPDLANKCGVSIDNLVASILEIRQAKAVAA